MGRIGGLGIGSEGYDARSLPRVVSRAVGCLVELADVEACDGWLFGAVMMDCSEESMFWGEIG